MHHTAAVVARKIERNTLHHRTIISLLTRKIKRSFHLLEQFFFFLLFRWHYRTSSELDGSSTSGLISRYGGGGYVLDFDLNRTAAESQLKVLKDNLWLNRGTRAVFLDFTVYNANINLFCQIKLIVEFPASGGAVTSKRFQSVKLIRVSDFLVLQIEKRNSRISFFSMFHRWIISFWLVKSYSSFSPFIIPLKK